MEHDDDIDWDAPVQLAKGELEVLLHLARIGDKAASMRSWRNWFRKVQICSGEEREPDCFQCRVFTRAEELLGSTLAER